LLDVRQQVEKVRAERAIRGGRVISDTRRQMLMCVMIMVGGQAELPQIVAALDPMGGLADSLHRWQQQTDQDGNNGDDDQQFDEREAAPPVSS
jgi:hypothetical protein